MNVLNRNKLLQTKQKNCLCTKMLNHGLNHGLFLSKINFFCTQKVEKTTLKSCSEELKSTFFPYCPKLPKGPKQKTSWSKIWLIDQLYIELGLRYSKILNSVVDFQLENSMQWVWHTCHCFCQRVHAQNCPKPRFEFLK